MSKRKWKVYTTDELRDRFQAKPGSNAAANEDQKIVVPNLKRRNSAPPGMIHFPPGTFSTGNAQNSHPPSNAYLPSSPHQQHELVTHARGSPTNKSHPYPASSSRLEKRRASLPYIPPATSLPGPHSNAPSIEAYLTHLQNIPLATHHDEDDDTNNPPLSPSHTLPSFQSLLKTIREDADEEDSEIREIEEHANSNSPRIPGNMQTSKTLPLSYKGILTLLVHALRCRIDKMQYMGLNKSPKQSREQHTYYQPTFAFPAPNQPQEPSSPSSKFYKNNNLSKSNENLPSLSRMSISDIIG